MTLFKKIKENKNKIKKIENGDLISVYQINLASILLSLSLKDLTDIDFSIILLFVNVYYATYLISKKYKTIPGKLIWYVLPTIILIFTYSICQFRNWRKKPDTINKFETIIVNHSKIFFTRFCK